MIILGPVIFQSRALLSYDPYHWTHHVLFLNQNGYVNTPEQSPIYPLGFILYCGGATLITPNFSDIFYFMEFGGFPYLILYLIVLYIILKKIISNNIIIVISLLICISNFYFLYRSVLFLSSSISVLVILIGTLIFLTESNTLLLGVVISGSFMINPIYAFFFILLVSIFYGVQFFRNSGIKRKILKEIGLNTLLSFGLISCYMLSLNLLYNSNLIMALSNYIRLINVPLDPQTIFNVDLEIVFEGLSMDFSDLVFNSIYLSAFLFFPVFTVFIKKDLNGDLNKNFKLFLKIAVVFIFIVMMITPILTLSLFFEIFYLRVIEGFNSFIIIAMGLIFSKIYSFIIDLRKKVDFSSIKLHKIQKIFSKKSWKVITLTIFFTYSTYIYLYAYNNFTYTYAYEDTMTDCVFYINENYEYNSRIGGYEIIHMHTIYKLLYNYEMIYYNQSYNWSFSEFFDFIKDNNIDGFIIKLSFFNETFIENFYDNTSLVQKAGGSNVIDNQLYEII